MKAKRNDKTLCIKKINIHVPSGQFVHNTFTHRCFNPIKIYPGKDCVGKLLDHIEDEVK